MREIARAARYGETLSCLLLDIDRFKHVNDTYGHARGDEILKAVSELIGRHTRECDCVCRYGGDEFCILLPQTGEPEAVAFADRLRGQIAQIRVTAGTRSVSVQATVGVAEWRQDVATTADRFGGRVAVGGETVRPRSRGGVQLAGQSA